MPILRMLCSPNPRGVQPVSQGKVLAIPQVGGLHHRYTRAAQSPRTQQRPCPPAPVVHFKLPLIAARGSSGVPVALRPL